MTLEEAIKRFSGSCMFITNQKETCEQLAEWLSILKKAKFEYDEAWRIIAHPTPDVTYADRDRAQVILDTFKDSLGRIKGAERRTDGQG